MGYLLILYEKSDSLSHSSGFNPGCKRNNVRKYLTFYIPKIYKAPIAKRNCAQERGKKETGNRKRGKNEEEKYLQIIGTFV